MDHLVPDLGHVDLLGFGQFLQKLVVVDETQLERPGEDDGHVRKRCPSQINILASLPELFEVNPRVRRGDPRAVNDFSL